MQLLDLSIATTAMIPRHLDCLSQSASIFSYKLNKVQIFCMENKVTNRNAQALVEETTNNVNPTILIGVFIAVSTFFILTSTIGTVVESFS